MRPKIKHIIWDWNGTLLNDVQLTLDIWNEELRLRRLPQLEISAYKQADKRDLYAWFLSLGFTSEDQLKDCLHSWYQKYSQREKECFLYPSSQEVLTQIFETNCKQSILSAHPEPDLLAILNHFEITHYFNFISGRNPITNDYSKISRGLKLVSDSNISAQETLIIGDSPHDAEVAEHLGTNCLLVDFGISDRQQVEKIRPTISNLTEIYQHYSF